MSQTVTIVDYGSGNLHSAAKAFERAANEAGHCRDHPRYERSRRSGAADRIVLPGVGAFADCRARARRRLRHGRGAGGGRPRQGPAVPRHLRRHAIDGERGLEYVTTEWPWLDRWRRRRSIRRRRRPEDPAYGLEHAAPAATSTRCSPASRPALPAARLFRALLCADAAKPQEVLALTDYGGPVTAIVGEGQPRRHPVSPREEPAARPRLISNFLKWRP
jgi:glutamine amidotransferase